MFLKLFHKKAIGLHVDQGTIKYALITYNKNKIIVNESQLFDIHCKTALQRLQSLLKKYPASILSPCSNVFFTKPPQDISIPKDQKKILKNKVEPLLEGQKVLIEDLYFIKKSSPSYFIAKKEEALKNSFDASKLTLSFQKKILAPQAALSLEALSIEKDDKLALFLSLDKVYSYLYSNGALSFYLCESIVGLSKEELLQKLLRIFYAKLNDIETKTISIHGAHPDLDFLLNQIEALGLFEIRLNEYGEFEKEDSEFLLEIGAALSLLKSEKEGITPLSFSSFFKIYKTSLTFNFFIILGLFALSSLYWNHRLLQIKDQNLSLYRQSSLNLGEKASNDQNFSAEQVEKLQTLLKKKKKESPSYLFEPSTFLVSDTLAWLSNLESKIKENENSAFFVLENFKYQISPPNKSSKGRAEKQTKISFSFSTDSSQVGRRLYEEISKANEIVDTSKKIDWNFQNDKYEVSFYLKRKGIKRGLDV